MLRFTTSLPPSHISCMYSRIRFNSFSTVVGRIILARVRRFLLNALSYFSLRFVTRCCHRIVLAVRNTRRAFFFVFVATWSVLCFRVIYVFFHNFSYVFMRRFVTTVVVGRLWQKYACAAYGVIFYVLRNALPLWFCTRGEYKIFVLFTGIVLFRATATINIISAQFHTIVQFFK